MPDTPARAGGTPPALPPTHLEQELHDHEALLKAQTKMVQRFPGGPGSSTGRGACSSALPGALHLPDEVVTDAQAKTSARVPPAGRERPLAASSIGSRAAMCASWCASVWRSLSNPPTPPSQPAARLLRHSTVMHMIHRMLPSGRSVNYRAPEGETIPYVPVEGEADAASAITATTDAIVEKRSPMRAAANSWSPTCPTPGGSSCHNG